MVALDGEPFFEQVTYELRSTKEKKPATQGSGGRTHQPKGIILCQKVFEKQKSCNATELGVRHKMWPEEQLTERSVGHGAGGLCSW